MDNDETMDNWKQFHGTELGGLMSKIYGNEGRPKINYPKPKTKPKQATDPFLPCGGKPNAVDPRKATRKAVNVAVPKCGKPSMGPISAINCVPRRRQEALIKDEIQDITMRKNHYRPAYVKPVSTDAEKDKYSQICAYKGGKGLPSELTQPVGDAPFELEARRKEAERMEKVRSKYRRGAPSAPPQPPRELSHREMMANQLAQEIDERCEFLQSMNEIGASASETSAVRAEIAQRVAELKRMEK
mmetsp:Transcript_21438/g.31061  ORF Transcript_21438/g.31061 Transcript_21438/m.31061 type:complete len:244 (+) Transcript_21438:107-838(+)